MLLSGCVTTFERVKASKTLDAAKLALNGESPTAINPHPPNAEAWYFGWQQCVLFVEGKLRLAKTVKQTGVKVSERATVDCSLEALAAEQAASPK